MTEQDRFDWSISIVVSATCSLLAVIFMVMSLCLDARYMRRCDELEEHLRSVQEENETLRRKMDVQMDLFASIVKGMEGEW